MSRVIPHKMISSGNKRSGSGPRQKTQGMMQSAISSYFKKPIEEPSPEILQLGVALKRGDEESLPLHRKKMAMQVDSDADDEFMEVDDDRCHNQRLKKINLLDNYKNGRGELNDNVAERENAFEMKFSLPSTRDDRTHTASLEKSITPSTQQQTQLEQQYHSIKAKHKDCILLLEVGYKYRFFGEDALVAAKILNIVAYMDHTLYTASFPTHRLNIHVRRLVNNGLKVGIVQQTETAALKAISSNKTGPFERKLTRIYTRGTFIEDFKHSSNEDDDSNAGTGCIVYMCESELNKNSSTIGLVAVSPSIGHILYDEFPNDYSNEALQTRLSHLQPVEIVVSKKRVGTHTLTYLKTCFSVGPVDGLPIRMEFDDNAYSVNESSAREYVISEYKKIIREQPESDNIATSCSSDKLSVLSNLPGNVILCIYVSLKHLSTFGLDSVTVLANEYTPFSSMNTVTLNSSALNSLDLYCTVSQTQEAGSLISILDHACTPMGRRTLRKWLLAPLVVKSMIQERLDAVEEIVSMYGAPEIKKLRNVFSSLPDLEKSICRMFYLRCRPSDLHSTLSSFKTLLLNVPTDLFKSRLLKDAVTRLADLEDAITNPIAAMNVQIAVKDETVNLLIDNQRYPEMFECKKNFEYTLALLEDHLSEIAKFTTTKPSYTTVAGISHLIEVPVSQSSKVPLNWIKINQTKSVARFHTPFIIEKLKTLDVCRELLQASSDDAYQEFLRSVANNNPTFKIATESASIIDCIISLAIAAVTHNYTKPQISDEIEIVATQSRNPVVESTVTTYTPNDINISASNRILLITGPNMGGKSSYIKQIALLVIMAQMGAFVPAKFARVGIFTSVLTRMGASDDITKGQSTFMKELTETSNIIKVATEKSLVIIDELGRGTSTHDGTAIAHSTLTYFIMKTKCITLFISHFTSLGELKDTFPGELHCYHMAYLEDKSKLDSNSIIFLYKVIEGLAEASYGLNVARLAGLLTNITSKARELSEDMRKNTEKCVIRSRLFKKISLARKFILSKGQPKLADILETTRTAT